MRFVPVVLLVFALGCGKNGNNNNGDDTGDPDGPPAPVPCTTDDQCADGMHCDATTGVCVGGCGGQFLDLSYVPPNIMFVLDRSCSMDANIMGTMTTKWEAAVASLATVLVNYADQIRWGLTMFPDTTGTQCAQDAIPFPLADGNAMPIKTALEAALATTDPNFPDGPCITNIDTGIQSAATDPGLMDPARRSYLMLVSDGAQSGCSAGGGDNGTEMSIDTLHQMGVDTFVVGFGSGTDAAQLNTFAMLGGQPLAGDPMYYQADTAAQLDMAFQAIATLVVSCDYHVDPAPPDVDQTYVFYNNTETVPRDPTHMMGWDYDPTTMTLTFYGGHCDRLKSREVTDVDVVFGCPTPPVF